METKIDSEENDEPVPVCVAVRVKAQDQLKQGKINFFLNLKSIEFQY